jgi:hypothetical protein
VTVRVEDSRQGSGRAHDDPLRQRRAVRWELLFLLGVLSAFGPLSMDLHLPALPQVAG